MQTCGDACQIHSKVGILKDSARRRNQNMMKFLWGKGLHQFREILRPNFPLSPASTLAVPLFKRELTWISLLWRKGWVVKLSEPAGNLQRQSRGQLSRRFKGRWDLPRDWPCSSCGCCGCRRSSRCGSQGDAWGVPSPGRQSAAPVASAWASQRHSPGGWQTSESPETSEDSALVFSA